MKLGIRTPSINKRIAARTSVKRAVKNSLGLKAPKGYGFVTNPKKYAYNKVYNKTTTGCILSVIFFIGMIYFFVIIIVFSIF